MEPLEQQKASVSNPFRAGYTRFYRKKLSILKESKQYILKIVEIVKEKTQVTAETQPWHIQRIQNISNMGAWALKVEKTLAN